MADTSRTAEIYLYQERFPSAGKLVLPVLTRFGVEIVVGGEVSETHFFNTGDLQPDRERARWYGHAIGKQLKERGTLNYNLHLNQRHANKPCIPERESDLWGISSEFEEAVEQEFGRVAV